MLSSGAMTLGRALLLIVGFVAILWPTRLVTMEFVPDTGNPFDPSAPLWLGLLVSSALAVTVVVWRGSVKAHGGWRALGWKLDAPLRQVALGLLGGVVAVALVIVFAFGAGLDAREISSALTTVSPAQRLVFLGVGLQAAVVEESLFRGNLQPVLEVRFGRALGLVFTAAIFAAYHLDPRPFSLGGKFAYGLIYGGLRSATGSLVSPALAHLCVWCIAGSL